MKLNNMYQNLYNYISKESNDRDIKLSFDMEIDLVIKLKFLLIFHCHKFF